MPTWESVMRTQISLPQPVPETVRSQRSPFVMGVKRFASLNLLITQRPDGRRQVLTEDLRQFPRGEVAALISLVPVDEVAEGTLPPTSRWPMADLSSDFRKYYAFTLNRESPGINYSDVDPRASRAALCVLRRAGLRFSNRVSHGPESCVHLYIAVRT